MVAFGVNEHTFTCSGNVDINFAIGTASAFKDVFDGWTTWDVTSLKTDGAVDREDFTDYSQYPFGADDVDGVGADWADVAFIYTHGVHECTTAAWSNRSDGRHPWRHMEPQ